MAEFHHVGVPVDEPQPGETYLEGAKVHITDASSHPYRFEYLRFEADSPLPERMQKNSHVAYVVDDLDAALEGESVLLEPFEPMDGLRCAFIVKDGVVLELMQNL
ncbi:MAG: hypothetical protein U9R68_01680 [Planctomycetota bacterium]|nr:hypothetical protein [Planctomycetota bacterium]